MRVLCLHGKGTSAAIFKSQTTSFRRLLEGLDIEFDFVDGPLSSPPAPGIDLFYPPPYYAFWEDDSPDEVDVAREWLADLIARSGPYDAVLAFSQGCALAAAELLHHQARADAKGPPPPFKAAIFICGGAPLKVAESLGFSVTPGAWEREHASRRALSDKAASSAILAQGSARWTAVDDADSYSVEDAAREVSGPPGLQIKIPTAHVYGSRDPRYFAGMQLSSLCDPQTRKAYNHGGGHEIPRGEAVSRTIADLVRWALAAGRSSSA